MNDFGKRLLKSDIIKRVVNIIYTSSLKWLCKNKYMEYVNACLIL